MKEVDPELRADARWQLIERITASPPFQKSARLRELLRFMAERSIRGQIQDLSEHRIGSAVFGKAQDYSVVEDSSVRVHVRQLRLKLHEYFDGEGRGRISHRRDSQRGLHNPLSSRLSTGLRRIRRPSHINSDSDSGSGAALGACGRAFSITTVVVWFRRPTIANPPRRLGRWLHSSIRPTNQSRWWLRTSTTG